MRDEGCKGADGAEGSAGGTIFGSFFGTYAQVYSACLHVVLGDPMGHTLSRNSCYTPDC